MDFGFGAGDRRPLCSSPDRHFAPPRAELFHGGPPPSLFECEAAAWRERIIREEVERRLIEKEVRRDLSLARARGGFGPVPFVGPNGHIVRSPRQGTFFRPDGPFTSPMPLTPMPVGMHPNWPPLPSFGSWEGFGSRRLAGFGQPMLLNETRTRSLPPPKPMHQLQLRMVTPSESSEVFSSETKDSGVKRKAHAISATTESTKIQNAARDWSCALCQVSATSESGLNQHLQGKKHKAKLVQCGAIKVMDTNKSGLHVTTGNNNGAGPSDAPKKIHILVDGEMHQVVQKSKRVWCERCRVSCTNAGAMADHLRGKKHSLLNKVWASIKAVRRNNGIKEDSATATCERKVNESGPAGIPEEEEHEEEGDTYMASEFSGDASSEIPMETKETTDMAEEADADSHSVTPVGINKEDTDTASKATRNYPAGTKQEDTGVVMDVNKNSPPKVHQKSRKEFPLKVHQESRKRRQNKKFLSKVHQKANENLLPQCASESKTEGFGK
ncbi:hypothetical protein ZEAMMB73_Zm00001d046827 [Zea mays]|uniref:C2H2-type domain-containing protein n=2 Tax=Zea mays TaxID=4577 RepID=K7VG00_MAIZE|nr:hypothetical protein ZEAMMB73_Zm00001d046827 [Zea mays]|eukprot:XP_008658226.1 uncharacterized protein LOC100272432 isoform X1 [Zea mays]